MISIVLLQMVGMDQLVQIVSGFGMCFVNVGYFRIGLSVNQIVEKIGNCHTQSNCQDHGNDTHLRFDGLNHQITADHTEHHTAGKAQQQTDSTVRILLQHSADQTAYTGAYHTSQKGGKK